MAAKQNLFGTDGVRGPAGTFLGPELATALGYAAATANDAERPQVLILRDTRESGPMLEAALAAGVAAAGGDAHLAGVLPSPAAAILVQRYGLDLAVVISASHNPYTDNGIKFFSARGLKLDDNTQAQLEAACQAELARSGTVAAGGGVDQAPPVIGAISALNGAREDYLRALQGHFSLDLSGRRILLDCANGAAHAVAPAIFERLGAEVGVIADQPDGRNINAGCGSTHPEELIRRLAAGEAEIGFAFDGDADRVLAVDATGRVRDGDEMIALIALHLAETGALHGGVAVTVMTNYGFHLAMERAGIEVATTPVGDRYVLAELLKRGWRLGGEQSGHLINTEFVPTGDGPAAALLLMQALAGRSLEAVAPIEILPQRLINVVVAEREAVAGAKAVWAAAERESAALAGHGRVLIRPSGTEPLVRVMVEAPEREQADQVCERLADLVERELGA